jgi:hypothetical protein
MNLPGGVEGERRRAASPRLSAQDFGTGAGDDQVKERRGMLVGREANPGGISTLQDGDPRDQPPA